MALGNILRTDNFTGVADQNYDTAYAPTGYSTLGINVGMKSEKLCLYNNFTVPSLMVTGINAGSGGGRIRSVCDNLSGNLPGVGWDVEPSGGVGISHFHAQNAGGTAGYRFIAHRDPSSSTDMGAIKLSIYTNVSDTRTIASTLLTGVTTMVGKIFDSEWIVFSSSIHFLRCQVFESDGTTLVGECKVLFYDDWPNSPAVSANNKFAVSGNWASMDNIVYYDRTLTGTLQVGEAHIFNVTQTGTLTVYCTPGQGGTAPYSYQWEKNVNSGGWNDVSGATSTILKETGITGSVQYKCRITDSAGSPQTTTSNTVTCVPGSSVTLFATGDSLIAMDLYGDYYSHLQIAFNLASKSLYFYNWSAGATNTGYQTTPVTTRYGTWIDRFGCDVFLNRVGTNNAYSGTAPATVQSELAAGTQSITLAKNVLLLYLCAFWSGTGQAPRNTNNATYDAVFSDLAAANPSLIKWQGNTLRTTTTANQTTYFQEAAPNELHPNDLGYDTIVPIDYTFITANLVSITSIDFDDGPTKTVPAGTTYTFPVTVVGNSTAKVFTLASAIGTVNASTGLYTAPEVAQADKTVVLTVTAADGTHTDTITITILGETSLRALAGGKSGGIQGGFDVY